MPDAEGIPNSNLFESRYTTTRRNADVVGAVKGSSAYHSFNTATTGQRLDEGCAN